jgi:adenylate kinase
MVLLGPPGVGKGTQARLLADTLGACALSMADVFRHQLEHSPDLESSYLREQMDHGRLLADDFVLETIRNRRSCLRCRAGFLLDGFPRTLAQAAALDAMLGSEHVRLDAVLKYELGTSDLVARMSGRRVCPFCHAVFNIASRPPVRSGVCDHCRHALVRLADDEPKAIESRLAAYAEATEAVGTHYERAGLVIAIPADGATLDVLKRTLAALESRGLLDAAPSRTAALDR